MPSIAGSEIMNSDLKDKQIRRCGTCGKIMCFGHGGNASKCSHCGGPVISLGPISWTDEDETKAMEDLGEVEDDGDRFQDVVCDLWDKIDDWKSGYNEKCELIKDLEAEIILHKNAIKLAEKEAKEAKKRWYKKEESVE